MRIELHEDAEHDLDEAATYYEERRAGLGRKLVRAFSDACAFLEHHPRVGRPVGAGVPGARRWIVEGFPYSIVYRVMEDKIFIVAVPHAKRRPGYWTHRL